MPWTTRFAEMDGAGLAAAAKLGTIAGNALVSVYFNLLVSPCSLQSNSGLAQLSLTNGFVVPDQSPELVLLRDEVSFGLVRGIL